MGPFVTLLRHNRNYRYTWLGQVVSEVGDHFNSIAVLSLALHLTGSGVAVGGVMIARALLAFSAGPLAGVILDRFDRKRIMIWSDLLRAAIALGFVAIPIYKQEWLMYVLSGLLTFCSPFFTSGRSAILPRITSPGELHTANALTQTTAWLTLSIGTMLGGVSTMQFGYGWAFVANASSFLFSAWSIWKLRSPEGHFRPLGPRKRREADFWGEYFESLRYMRSTPLILALGLVWVGWATGGGAAQILFTLFGEVVFQRGPAGIGIIWGSAGLGLVAGGLFGHWLLPRITFAQYKHTIGIVLFLHGVAYALFAVMPTLTGAVVFITLSRMAMGTNNVLNRTMLLTHVPDRFRGRVFSTVEMMMNSVMMISLAVASAATLSYSPRTIGVVAGLLSTSAAFPWIWANLAGKLPEPPRESPAEEEPEMESGVTPA